MIPNARIPALIAITLTDWAREQGLLAWPLVRRIQWVLAVWVE